MATFAMLLGGQYVWCLQTMNLPPTWFFMQKMMINHQNFGVLIVKRDLLLTLKGCTPNSNR
jgi:hypothetical protein